MENPSNIHQEATEYKEKGDFVKYIAKLEEAIKIAGLKNDTEHARSWNMELSEFYFDYKNFEKAAEHAESATKVDDSFSTREKIFQGICLYHLGRIDIKAQKFHYEESIRCFDEVLRNVEFGEARARAFKNKGNALCLLGKFEEALQSYDDALRALPIYPPNLIVNKGNAFLGLKNYVKAIMCYQEGLQRFEKGFGEIRNREYFEKITHLHLGIAEYYNGNTLEAIRIIKNVVEGGESNRINALCHNVLGLCYLKKENISELEDNIKEAEHHFKKALNQDSNLIDANYNLAVLFIRKKNVIEAKYYLNRCLQIDRNFEPAKIAMKKLESLNKTDWMSKLGFGENTKKIVNYFLLGSLMIGLVVLIALVLFDKSFTNEKLYASTLFLGIPLVLLILPYLKNIALGEMKIQFKDPPIDKNDISIDIDVIYPQTDMYE
jgi:tetratricopeptide (TPR) repeat protein